MTQEDRTTYMDCYFHSNVPSIARCIGSRGIACLGRARLPALAARAHFATGSQAISKPATPSISSTWIQRRLLWFLGAPLARCATAISRHLRDGARAVACPTVLSRKRVLRHQNV